MIDIDNFKCINDTQGHAAGDMVLRRFSELAGNSLRPKDVLARWGGEEFLLMLPATSPEAATQLVEQLRMLLFKHQSWSDNAPLRVTISAGIASHRPGESMVQTIARADTALYQAKSSGRNRWILL